MRDSMRLPTDLLVMLLACLGVGLAAPESVLADGEAAGESMVRGECNLEAAAQVDLRSEVDRPLPILFVAPGGKVASKGALLLELDAAPLIEELEKQRMEYANAKAKVVAIEVSIEAGTAEANATKDVARKALQVAEGALKVFLCEKGEYQLERKKHQATIHASEKRLAAAKVISKLVEQRVQMGQAATEELDQIQLVMTEAETELTVAKAELEFLEEVLKGQRVAELELQIARRKLDLIRADGQLRKMKVEGDAALTAVRTSIELAKSRLSQIEGEIAACKIHAPRAGTVLYPGGPAQGGIQRGAVVRPRQLLLRLLDTKRLKAVVRTSVEEARQTAPGQSAKIRVDAFPDRAFQGRITQVGVARPSRPGRGAEITVLLDNPEGKLRPGMTATVEIKLSGGSKE